MNFNSYIGIRLSEDLSRQIEHRLIMQMANLGRRISLSDYVRRLIQEDIQQNREINRSVVK